ncbi:MAG: hypothetical protein LC737_07355 [Chloroflexi bacterium]|nr:hypothetical protein [Chloroflexota bacterium]
MRNIGQNAEDCSVALSGSAWTHTLWNGGFTETLGLPVHLDPCVQQTIGVRTQISSGAARNQSDVLTLSVQPHSGGVAPQSRAITGKTPATVLLVDDDRWYDVDGAYQAALNANSTPFDKFDTYGGSGPSLARLSMYPVTVWLSGYDWFDPLNDADENNLRAYLNGGGRLFYSAQDYLYVRGNTSTFARDYFGVLTYTNDMTVTSVSGVPDNIISSGLGPYSLTYPYRNFSDYVTPTLSTRTTFIGNNIAGAAVNYFDPFANFKTVFFAYPFEALAPAQQPTVMRNVLGWLTPLGESTLSAPRLMPYAGRIQYQLQLSSSNLAFVASARITTTLPSDVSLVSLDSPGLSYDIATRRVIWSGTLDPSATPNWTVQLSASASPGYSFTTTSTFDDGEGIVFTRSARTTIAVSTLYFPFTAR